MKTYFIIPLAVLALMGNEALGQTQNHTAAPVTASNSPIKGDNTALAAGTNPPKNIVIAKLDSLIAASKAKAEKSAKELALTKQKSEESAKQAEKSAQQAELSAKQAKIAQGIAAQLTKVNK
ncbi:hypothetical protein [Flexibacter flexilis]|nr:hypothetical protein [Flexibacter flexilis]